MGLKDRIQDQRAAAVEQSETSTRATGHAGYEYDAEVNKKSINMRTFAVMLNDRASKGWRLHTAFEQDGNTVTIFERAKS